MSDEERRLRSARVRETVSLPFLLLPRTPSSSLLSLPLRCRARMEFDTLRQCPKIPHEIYSCCPLHQAWGAYAQPRKPAGGRSPCGDLNESAPPHGLRLRLAVCAAPSLSPVGPRRTAGHERPLWATRNESTSACPRFDPQAGLGQVRFLSRSLPKPLLDRYPGRSASRAFRKKQKPDGNMTAALAAANMTLSYTAHSRKRQ